VLADVELDERDGNPVARVRGEIDLSNAGVVSSTLQNAVAQSAAGMVVDFSETRYLDSAGVHCVFELGKRLRDRGQRLYLVVPDESPVSSVLEFVNVGSLAPLCRTLDGALDRLSALPS
jgi:anti-anti-sigma factor